MWKSSSLCDMLLFKGVGRGGRHTGRKARMGVFFFSFLKASCERSLTDSVYLFINDLKTKRVSLVLCLGSLLIWKSPHLDWLCEGVLAGDLPLDILPDCLRLPGQNGAWEMGRGQRAKCRSPGSHPKQRQSPTTFSLHPEAIPNTTSCPVIIISPSLLNPLKTYGTF